MPTFPALLLLCLFTLRAVAEPPASSTPIVLDQSGPDIFPSSWRQAPVNVKAAPLAEGQAARAREILQRALARYPAQLLRTELKQVYVIGRLEYNGVATGGTNSLTAVYLACDPKWPALGIERVFHAEFSSILLRNHPKFLDQEAWQKLNPPGFRYLDTGVQAIKEGKAGQSTDEALLREGFMVQYAKSTLENDFNGLADRLFTADPALWQAAQTHPAIQGKINLTIAFYTKLDAAFTRAWFEGLCKGAAAAQ